MTFERARLGMATVWVLAVVATGVGTGVAGAVPVLWVSALALIPASLAVLLWQPPARSAMPAGHGGHATP